MSVRIGTSGWSYPHWDGVLYPPGLPAAGRLSVYIEAFTTVELNASFYRWPRENAFASWRKRLPEDFVMSVKAPRGLTHGARLADPRTWVTRIATGLNELGERRAILLVQLAPSHERHDGRLEDFLALIPDRIQVAVEFRHPSWHVEPIFRILEAHQAAYCVMSGAGLPCVLRATAPFVYVRLHGPDDVLYAGSYRDDDLRWWADRIGEWRSAGLDVYAYFNNDGYGHAVRNALGLRQLLGA